MPPRRMLAGATLAIAVFTTTATVLVVLHSGSTALGERLTDTFGILGAALFLGSGLLGVSRWRLTGDSRSLMMAAALVVLGGLALPLTSVAGVIMDDSGTSLLRAMTALTSHLVALALIVRALNTPPEQPCLHPLRIVLPAALTALVIFAGLVTVHVVSPGLLTSTLVPPPMIRGSLLAIAWFAVGLEATMRSTQLPWAGRVAPLLGCMAVAELLRVISVVQPGAWEVSGAALVAVIASLTAHRALIDLEEAGGAAPANRDAAVESRTRADATNGMAGARAALVALEEHGARLDAATKERIRAAALGEVSHLEHLIIRGDRAETVDFDLDPVLRTVVETRRALGMEIELSGRDVRVHGRPGDVATVLQTLLANADQHAGRSVVVTVVPVGETVEILVADDGPGMPATQVATLFQRGARGPQSTGTGLGLHVSHLLMQRQGGDLELRSHADGCTFGVSMPAGGVSTPVALPVQRRVRVAWPRPVVARPFE